MTRASRVIVCFDVWLSIPGLGLRAPGSRLWALGFGLWALGFGPGPWLFRLALKPSTSTLTLALALPYALPPHRAQLHSRPLRLGNRNTPGARGQAVQHIRILPLAVSR